MHCKSGADLGKMAAGALSLPYCVSHLSSKKKGRKPWFGFIVFGALDRRNEKRWDTVWDSGEISGTCKVLSGAFHCERNDNNHITDHLHRFHIYVFMHPLL